MLAIGQMEDIVVKAITRIPQVDAFSPTLCIAWQLAHRKRCAPVKNADVIEAQEAALKYIAPVGSPEAAVR